MPELPRVQALKPRIRAAFDDPKWLFEPKYHGFRGMLRINKDQAYFQSKSGKPMPRFDWLAKKLQQGLKVHNAILDGEIAALHPVTGHPMFGHLLRNQREYIVYVAFDLLFLNGCDLRSEPLIRRKQKLAKLLQGQDLTLVIGCCVGTGRALYQWICLRDLEGIVAKRITDPYTPQTIWYKIKNPKYSQRNIGKIFQKQKPR
ncbi:MAG TPA: hypothetical protein VL306_00900 [Methylomirabilota bacterium]|jgi:bifunctional non-homologous end joining protein LigD|nr:hypothetical protein [Methylomirabilota bacterium]